VCRKEWKRFYSFIPIIFMSLDMDLDQVRVSLMREKEKAYRSFEGRTPEELAIYFLTGNLVPPYETPKRNLNSLRHLVSSYVETTRQEFRERFMECLSGCIRPDEVYEVDEESELREFLSSVSFDFHLRYSEMLGARDEPGIEGLKERVYGEKRRVSRGILW